MWPPTEMPLTVNEKARLITISVNAWPVIAAGLLVLDDQERAEDPEDRARCADGDRGRSGHQRPRSARKPGDDVEREIAKMSDVALDRHAEPADREHVQADVKDVCVEERGGQQAPPVALRDSRSEEHPLRKELAAGRVDPCALRDGDQVDHDVERRSSRTRRTVARDCMYAKRLAARSRAGARCVGFPCVAWSGQRGPTGVIRRHSVQMGRSQTVHERPVSRFGWR